MDDWQRRSPRRPPPRACAPLIGPASTRGSASSARASGYSTPSRAVGPRRRERAPVAPAAPALPPTPTPSASAPGCRGRRPRLRARRGVPGAGAVAQPAISVGSSHCESPGDPRRQISCRWRSSPTSSSSTACARGPSRIPRASLATPTTCAPYLAVSSHASGVVLPLSASLAGTPSVPFRRWMSTRTPSSPRSTLSAGPARRHSRPLPCPARSRLHPSASLLAV